LAETREDRFQKRLAEQAAHFRVVMAGHWKNSRAIGKQLSCGRLPTDAIKSAFQASPYRDADLVPYPARAKLCLSFLVKWRLDTLPAISGMEARYQEVAVTTNWRS